MPQWDSTTNVDRVAVGVGLKTNNLVRPVWNWLGIIDLGMCYLLLSGVVSMNPKFFYHYATFVPFISVIDKLKCQVSKVFETNNEIQNDV